MRFYLTILFALYLLPSKSQSLILGMEQRAKVINAMLEDKIKNYLPAIMRREGLDMWIIVSREYNEDPVIKTMLPATWLAARRRTILIIYDNGNNLETMAVARYNVGNVFKKSWDKESQPDQWLRVAEIIKKRNPQKIGINKSSTYGLADGIVATDLEELKSALGKQASKIVSSESVAIGWLETRTKMEMSVYPQICKIAHEIIAEAFSTKVIQPGVTSTDDVVWWMRDKIRELKLTTWFHPTVSIQRNDSQTFDQLETFSNGPAKNIIQPGDLLHCDFGITYLRLNTDTQQHAYVLRSNEKDAPDYLKSALSDGNRLQDIFTLNFKEGRTGNDVLRMSREAAIKEGIKPTIYTHPIGYHGHAAGTTLGMWDSQGGVPGSGDYPLHLNTAYSIELNAAVFVKAWNKEIRIMLEEEAFFGANGVWYIDGRQTTLHLISQ